MSVIDYILYPFGWIVRVSYNLTGSYALALLFFAIAMKIVLLPFGIKQQKNMIKQAKLAPKEAAIRKKYAGRNDRVSQQKMMTEIQEMQQREGFSMFGGCLPLLLQMPIIMILYRIVYMPLTYISEFTTQTIDAMKAAVEAVPDLFEKIGGAWKQAELQLLNVMKTDASVFAGIEGFDANKIPRTNLFGVEKLDLTAQPNFNENLLLCLIPVLVFVTTFLSMKLMKKFTYQSPMQQQQQGGCSGGIMDISMPLFSLALSFSLSASIGIYWIYQSVLGFIQQVILAKLMPPPKYTEEDYKKAEKEVGVNDKELKKQQSAQKIRSLHHIDDDDDIPPLPQRKKGEHAPEDDAPAKPAPEKTEPTDSPIGKAPLKDESDKKDR